jgi:hypothetical protein
MKFTSVRLSVCLVAMAVEAVCEYCVRICFVCDSNSDFQFIIAFGGGVTEEYFDFII